jgi:hypothetical protein
MPPVSLLTAKAIVKQAIRNLGLHEKSEFSSEEIDRIRAELETIVLVHGDIGGFVGENPDQTQLEFLPKGLSDDDTHRALARNLFRYLLHISDVCVNPGDTVLNSPLLQTKMLKSILSVRDPKLFTAARHEMQQMLDNIFRRLQHADLTPEQEKSYRLFLDLVLSIYPFIDPVAGDPIFYPTKAPDGTWVRQEYVIKKLNISPHTGLLSYLLEEEDYIYAYGLEPVNNHIGASSIALIMGTTYPAGQGYRLANLYNFYPHFSVGEGHDFVELDAWLATQDSVIIKGHSKGATISMIQAATHPEKIKRADCFNPAPLTGSTLARLSPAWNALKQKPTINVYLQDGDPIGFVGRGYLKGSNIIRIIPGDGPEKKITFAGMGYFRIAAIKFVDACNRFFRNMSQFYERHVLYHFGRSGTMVIRGNVDSLNQSKGREFVGKMKSVLNYPIFAIYYVNLVVTLCLRRVQRFYDNHRNIFRFIIGAATIITLVTLLGMGILFPPVAALAGLLPFGWGALVTPYLPAVAAVLAIAASAVAPFVLEWSLFLANEIVGFAVGLAQFAVTLAIGLLSSVPVAFSLIEVSKKKEVKGAGTYQFVYDLLKVDAEEKTLLEVDAKVELKSPKRLVVDDMSLAFFEARKGVVKEIELPIAEGEVKLDMIS